MTGEEPWLLVTIGSVAVKVPVDGGTAAERAAAIWAVCGASEGLVVVLGEAVETALDAAEPAAEGRAAAMAVAGTPAMVQFVVEPAAADAKAGERLPTFSTRRAAW